MVEKIKCDYCNTIFDIFPTDGICPECETPN